MAVIDVLEKWLVAFGGLGVFSLAMMLWLGSYLVISRLLPLSLGQRRALALFLLIGSLHLGHLMGS